MTNQQITGTLTTANNKSHIAHQFEVPAGATQLSIDFDFNPQRSTGQTLNNDLSLTLFDPNGARGARHNQRDQNLRINAHFATPGYVPGPIPPGTWTVVIDTHRIMPPDTISYQFDIHVSTDPVTDPPPDRAPRTVAPRGAGWYRGDLHGHTQHSDARWTVADFVQTARAYQLDFVTLTDHNTVSGLAELDSLAGDDLLTMGGIELTTYYGHCLALGTRDWLDWRARSGGKSMTEIAQAVLDHGAFYVIAHPMSPGDPYCTGCDWQFDDMMPGIAPAVEVWNGPWGGDSGNEASLQLYYRWLNEGYRLVATAGTDIHGKPPANHRPVGFNIVYADDLSEAAILNAIRRGHSYLSSGPRLELTAQMGDHNAMLGDALPPGETRFVLNWSDCAETDMIRVMLNGAVSQTADMQTSGDLTWTLATTAGDWCAVEVRAADGLLRAVTNPIFAR